MVKRITVNVREFTALDFVETLLSMQSMGLGEVYSEVMSSFQNRTARHEFEPFIALISLHSPSKGVKVVGIKKGSFFQATLWLDLTNTFYYPPGRYKVYHRSLNEQHREIGVVHFDLVEQK
jgi:hypothetical protein